MSTRAETILLCATYFWAGSGGIPKTTPTLRKGVRHVARKQGISPQELDRAERFLVSRGMLVKVSEGVIALTDLGAKVAARACKHVSLPPWTKNGRPTYGENV